MRGQAALYLSMRARLILIIISISSVLHADQPSDPAALYFSGQSDKALAAYLAAYETSATPETLINAAVITKELGKLDEAILLLEKAKESGLTDSDLLSELAWNYLCVGQFEKAKEIYSSNKLSPFQDSSIDLGRGWLEFELGNFYAADRHLSRLLDANPRNTLVSYFRAKIAETNGRLDEAIELYRKVIINDSHFIEVRPALASLYEKKMNMDAAWGQFARLSSADSKNAAARNEMKRLSTLIEKKPEEILAPKRISTHTVVSQSPSASEFPVIKVGIGSTRGGKPSPKRLLSFRTSSDFWFVDPESKKKLQPGVAKEVWLIEVTPKGDRAEIIAPDGSVRGKFYQSIYILQDSTATATTILNSLRFAPDTSWGGMSDREVRGMVEVRFNRTKKTLSIVNHVSLENYLYGVLAAEMPVYWPLEALKAQAVIARNQALYRKGFHKRNGYDVCDEEHCQVYTGVSVESPKVHDAVDQTRGELLRYQGRLAHTVFSSNCGGVTQSGSQAGWGDSDYWKSFPDSPPNVAKPETPYSLQKWLQKLTNHYCQASKYTYSPEYRWSRIVEVEDIANRLAAKKKIGRLEQIQIVKRNGSGRVKKIRFVGTVATIDLDKEHEIRKYMGLGSLRSTLFTLHPVHRKDQLDYVLIMGGGWGHAVGLCQSGAAGRAEVRQTYHEILKTYFPGTTLGK